MRDRRRSFLCSRCGEIVEPPEPDSEQSQSSVCPSCGLGFTTSTTSAVFASSKSDSSSIEHPINTVRRRNRIDRDQRQAISRCDFAVYGLDETWSGSRWVGGWGGGPLELAHGDAYDESAPLLRVETAPKPSSRKLPDRASPEAEDAWAISNSAQVLAETLWHEGAEHSPALRAPFSAGDPTAGWSSLPLIIDGRPVTFRSLAADNTWVALGQTESAIITLFARNFDPTNVRLVVIDDFSPYLDSSRR
jgi:DNA-directed RNA polymerase subunit RPC12/RpoP